MPEALNHTVYSVNDKCNKFERSVRIYGNPGAFIATVDHDLHRLRRSVMENIFSIDNVQRLDFVIQGVAAKMIRRIQDLGSTGQPINLSLVYYAFTSDVLTTVAFGKCFNYLDKVDFNEPFFRVLKLVHFLGPIAKQFGWVLPLVLRLPDWMVILADPNMKAYFEFKKVRSSYFSGDILLHIRENES
jgi:hypothetical protein